MNDLRQPKMIFVVGVWRSGTSLLHAMLHQHPQIALMYEAEPFGLYARRRKTRFPRNWPARLEIYNQAISRHRLDPSQLPFGRPGNECLRTMFRAWAARKNAVIMGGKSPSYHLWLPQLARLFPEADFIILWRNPLDSCRSAVQAGRQNRFFRSDGILLRMLFGGMEMAKGVKKLRAAGRRVHELTFAELVANPEAALRGICAFLGVEFDSRMLDLQSADNSMVPPGEHHVPVRSGAVQKNRERPEVLPEAFVAKGRRYLALWREQTGDLAFQRTLPADAGISPPGRFEQMLDRLTYRHWLARVALKRTLLRRLPLNLWQRLRGQPAAKGLADKTAAS